MIIRVPLLLQKSVAIIYRLNISATRTTNPTGEDNFGYDETLREPITYENPTGTVQETRKEDAETRVPCQVETWRYEELREAGFGDAPVTDMIFVFHRQDLKRLNLLDSDQNVILKKGDRISHLERFGTVKGVVTKRFSDPGYLYMKCDPEVGDSDLADMIWN